MSDHVNRKMCYVAGPFTSNPAVNTRQAIIYGEQLEQSGSITACVPHLNILWDLVHPHGAEFWLDYDLGFLVRCDALLRIPGDSPGADDEVRFANANGIPVFETVESVIEWAANDK